MNQNHDIFISYRRSDGLLQARLLKASLQQAGYRVFLDMDMSVDESYDRQIVSALRGAATVILLLTPDYLNACTDVEGWVNREICLAVSEKKRIIPIAIVGELNSVNTSLPWLNQMLSYLQFSWIDFGPLYQESLSLLIRRIGKPSWLRRWINRLSFRPIFSRITTQNQKK